MINVPHILGTHFIQFNLSDLLEQLGEESVKSVLSSFSCPLNRDVEFFLKHKSIEMSRRNFSKTYLVFWETDDQLEREFVGYYALAAKTITVDPSVVSNRQKNKLREYGSFDTHINKFIVNATLIGQLGKNYSNGNDTLISGSDLLQMAIDKAKEVQNIIGGRYVCLECEDNKKLLDFYTSNHFVEFGSRTLDGDVLPALHACHLVFVVFTLHFENTQLSSWSLCGSSAPFTASKSSHNLQDSRPDVCLLCKKRRGGHFKEKRFFSNIRIPSSRILQSSFDIALLSTER